ncbi:MAG: primosomal protein N' [Salibacteraceae bacterium]
MSDAFYIQVILPLALRGAFTYRVHNEQVEEVAIGKRVVVPFGKRRYYAAIIYKLNVQPPRGASIKDISYVLDDVPVVTDIQLRFWEWIGFYYMSGMGAIMNAALPNAMKISSQTTVSLNPEFEEYEEFTDDERMVIAQLQSRDSMGVNQLEGLGTKRAIQRAVNQLLKKGVILITEELKAEVKPQTIEHIVLARDFASDETLAGLLEDLGNAPKQFECVMRYLGLQESGSMTLPIKKKQLTEGLGVSTSSITALIKKNVFESIQLLRYEGLNDDPGSFHLNDIQRAGLQKIKDSFQNKSVALLHGVTGSGKTLVYAQLIKENIEAGKQTLFLVPEIALTTQLVQRVKKLIGAEILVYHSRFSNKERLTTWLRLVDSLGSEVVIGARSSLFLPLNNLGLVIVDEEHEGSYKQHEVDPHYNARDAAIWLAKEVGAKVLLGSATPSVETYFNAKRGKFGFAEIQKRFDDIQMPLIRLVDMTKSKKADMMKASFSAELIEAMKANLARRKQIILFQNRRGFAPFMICEACGWSAECTNCDVNLTYHKFFEKMLCHYCGYSLKLPRHCPNCSSAKLSVRGFGTEKLEDELEILFPNARIARMDLDTTRKKNAFQNIITAFDEQLVDILVGTQMVTKGLDFHNVGLVGVMNADGLWNRPDFRAFERSYQLLTQVAGRAGRKNARGEVLIQTFKMDHQVLQFVINNSYLAMYEHQMAERQQFAYPPFARMIRFQFAHPDAKMTRDAAEFFAGEVRNYFKSGVLGPEEPSIPRIRGKYLRHLFLKIDPLSSMKEVRKLLWMCVDKAEGHPDHRKVRIQIDVDPY